jgi:hypothetical protein
MSNIIILEQFKKQLIAFMDELISQFPEESSLIILRILFKDQLPIEDVILKFIHKLVITRPLIKERNEAFFLDNNSLFSFAGPEVSTNLKRIWRSGRLDAEDKKVIWEWIDSFVFLADKYSVYLENNARV